MCWRRGEMPDRKDKARACRAQRGYGLCWSQWFHRGFGRLQAENHGRRRLQAFLGRQRRADTRRGTMGRREGRRMRRRGRAGDGEEGAAREEGTISEGRRGRGNDVPAKSRQDRKGASRVGAGGRVPVNGVPVVAGGAPPIPSPPIYRPWLRTTPSFSTMSAARSP